MAAEHAARRLHERTPDGDASAAGRARLDDLARTYFGAQAEVLARYLAMIGLTAAEAAARCDAGGAPPGAPPPVPDGSEAPSRNHPLAHDHAEFEAALAAALADLDTPLDVASVVRAGGAQYAAATEELAAPSIVLEMQIARASARRSRDHFQRFLTALRDERCESVLRTYPVLRRLLAEHRRRDHEATVETMQRLAADRDVLARRLGIPPDDPVCDLAAVGDRHRGGRRTTVVAFDSGRRVVYKPRPLDTVDVFGRVVAWLADAGVRPHLRAPAVVRRDGYGWCEWIAPHGCSSPLEVDAYYERMGVLCGVMYLLDATDLHLENVIAAGEHPVVIDLETLFHNDPPAPDAFWANPLGETVLRSGLLPWRYHGRGGAADLSAIGARSGQPAPHLVQRWEGLGTGDLRLGPEEPTVLGPADNAAHLDGVPTRAQDHVEPLLAGLGRVLDVAAARREELIDLLAQAATAPSRHVVRPTASYGELLQHGRHPTLLGDAVERDCYLAARLLRGRVDARIARSELDALWRNDIPLCTTTPAGRELVLDDGATIDDYFPRSSLERVRDRVAALDAAAAERQAYCARLSIEVLDAAGPPPGPTGGALPTGAPCPPGTLVDEAVAIGERLAALALAGGEHVTWPGVLAVGDDYHFGLTGPDVYNGAAGIAIFLAHLARHTGRGDYADLARRAVRGSAHQLAGRRPALGAFTSVAGLLLAIDHVSSDLEDPTLRADLAPPAATLGPIIEADTAFDVVGGGAGTLLVLLALGAADPDVPAIVGRLGDRICAGAIGDRSGAAWPNPRTPVPLLGFGHGTAGIALALARYAAFAGDRRASELTVEALAHSDHAWDATRCNWPDLRNGPEHPQATNAWCHGAPGEIAARHAIIRAGGRPAGGDHLDAATEQVLSQGLGGNDSLCHGDLGNLECIAPFVQARRPHLAAAVDAAVGRRVEARRDSGRWTCGVARGLETPGLFVGLAGIGLALLRHVDPTIASVLTLEPAGSPWWH